MTAKTTRISQNQGFVQSFASVLKITKAMAKRIPAAQKYSISKTYVPPPASVKEDFEP